MVSTYVADLEAELGCLASAIASYRQANNLARPKVLWGTPPSDLPPTASGVWSSIGTCPNFYCEAIERAGGDVLNNLTAVSSLAPVWNPSTYSLEGGPNASTLFDASIAGQADVILVPGPLSTSTTYTPLTASQCSTVYDSSAVFPTSVPAVANQQVYDTGRIRDPNGGVDWFTSRLATPDVLVESIAAILYPGMNIRGDLGTEWWQNVYTDSACIPASGIPTVLNTVVQCRNASDVYLPARNFACPTPTAAPTATPTTAVPPVTDGSSGTSSKLNGLSTLNVALIAICGALALLTLVVFASYIAKRRQLAVLTADQEPVMNAVFIEGESQ